MTSRGTRAAVSTGAAVLVTKVAPEYDGGIELTRDGRVYGIRSGDRTPVVSGADEDLFALALRIAAARIVSDRSGLHPILLLDEPFGTLDAARSIALVSALRELEPGPHQILLTTQDATLASRADRVIHIVRTPTGAARISQTDAAPH